MGWAGLYQRLGVVRSEQERNDGFALGGVLGEAAVIVAVVGDGAGDQVGGCPECERETAERPSKDRPTAPLDELTEIIGA